MTEQSVTPASSPGWLRWELDARVEAVLALHAIDIEAQLIAVRALLKRNAKADQLVRDDIRALAEEADKLSSGDDEQHFLEERWVEENQRAVYQDAAHSMAAVGMLAPLCESLFVAVFQTLRSKSPSTNVASVRGQAASDEFWDPHYLYGKGGRQIDLTQGILQLCQHTGLAPRMPTDLNAVLGALFAYRNKMFHHGFEWPMDERTKFQARLDRGEWPDGWFAKATSGGQPWIFYLSPLFVDHCLQTVENVLEGMGQHLKNMRAIKA